MNNFGRTEPAEQNLILGTAPLDSSGTLKGEKSSFVEKDNCEGKEQAGIV